MDEAAAPLPCGSPLPGADGTVAQRIGGEWREDMATEDRIDAAPRHGWMTHPRSRADIEFDGGWPSSGLEAGLRQSVSAAQLPSIPDFLRRANGDGEAKKNFESAP